MAPKISLRTSSFVRRFGWFRISMRGLIGGAALAGNMLLGVELGTAAIIWDQSDVRINSVSPSASYFLVVTDFVLAQPTTLAGFSVWLSDGPLAIGGDGIANGIFNSFSGVLSWYVIADNGGLPDDPATVIQSGFDAAAIVTDTGIDRVGGGNEDIFRVDGVIAPSFLLPAGTYWFGIREGIPGAAEDPNAIVWLGATAQLGASAYTYANGGNAQSLVGQFPYDDRALLLRDDRVSVPGRARWGRSSSGSPCSIA